jgi:hypothetical protein
VTDPVRASVADRSVFDRATTIADAVLYEGYVLYPYRASAGKNQVRWQFGVLTPKAFSEDRGSDPWAMQTECVVDPVDHPTVQLRLRCLQVQSRTVEVVADGAFNAVESLEVGGTLHTSWDEAVEREFDLPDIVLDPVQPDWRPRRQATFSLPAGREEEPLTDADGVVVGRVVRERQPVTAAVEVTPIWLDGPTPLVRLRIRIENRMAWNVPGAARDEVVLHSLVAVHTLLAVTGGRFVSLLDPPEFARPVTESCENLGTYPVLVGTVSDPDDGAVVLSSPIILYDHPEVAPESPGALFDSTEIDEILALRILTLTDEEKREARATDTRVTEIFDRVDAMPPEMFDRLHGAVRYLDGVPASAPPTSGLPGGLEPESETAPWWDPGADAGFDPAADSVWIAGTQVGRGAKVRLRPRPGADAHDMFLAGRAATVEAVLHDVDDEVHVAVVLDDDPGADLFAWQGRFNYFRPDELEVLS